ncbi:LytR/AlgR family response regulator transcription factor [Pedobacter sp. GSP4]|uniref:LytR/AlgR family response regulator transcription factor n=1 Tax=Pedobacter sp. GSP4 TaxID=3453716 RepID=UPI003EEE39D4
MNCLIVDDHAIARSIIRHLLKIEKSVNVVAECENAEEVYKNMAIHKIDLLLLDIQMPETSGIDLVKSLGSNRPLIIFISSHKDHAATAFDLNVVDFITKPLMPERFLQAITKAKEIYKAKNIIVASNRDEFIFIRDSGVIRRLNLADINYLEAKGDYVKIYLFDKSYSIYASLKSVEDKLPSNTFIRIHRSFIINVGKIDTIEGNTLIINKSFVPISDAYKNVLNKRMQIL